MQQKKKKNTTVHTFSVRLSTLANPLMYLRENGTFFECFPYVCPEPVLVK
jgi:hypothetical protein